MGGFRKALVYTAVLIGGYIAFTQWKGFKADVLASGNAGGNVVKTLQGR